MKFDEMIEKLLNNEDYNTDGLSVDDVITLIEVLRLEYAPPVEMTKGKAKTILDPEDGKNITDLLTDEVPNFDYLFWEPLTDKQVVQAWLHPETIKVGDE